jgi:replication-associated recombination protein RarA
MKEEAQSLGSDVQKIISNEWQQLDEGKKKHFNIASEVQKNLRANNLMANLEARC